MRWGDEAAERLKSRQRVCHRANQKYLYGLLSGDYDEMLVAQGGVCAICRRPPSDNPLDVDHDHTTGEVRGLLCHRCNVGLGYFGDGLLGLESALRYLGG